MDIRIQCLCIDTTDPGRLATFWQSALGWRRTFGGEKEVVLEPPEGSPEDGVASDLLFLRVPQGRREVQQPSPGLRASAPAGSTWARARR